jgi:hypothetical protein
MGKVRKNSGVVATPGSKTPSVGSRKKADGGKNKTGSSGKKAGGEGNKVSNIFKSMVCLNVWGI